MLRSKKDSKDLNSNSINVKIGKYESWQDILSLTVWDDGGTEYSIKSLLEKIFELETKNIQLKSDLEKTNKALKLYSASNDEALVLITKAADLMSLKISQLEKDVQELQDKTRYL